jgi:hypothetical protein
MALDPLCITDSLSSRSTDPENDYFCTHLFRNVESSEKLVEQVKLAYARKGNKRRGVGNDDHNLR